MASTTTEARTNGKVLTASNPSNMHQAFKAVDLGELFSDLTSMTLVVADLVGSNLQLAKAPIGAVIALHTEGGIHVPLIEIPTGSTLGALEFSVDYDTGILSVGTGTVAATDQVTVQYHGLTRLEESGPSALFDTLAEVYGS